MTDQYAMIGNPIGFTKSPRGNGKFALLLELAQPRQFV